MSHLITAHEIKLEIRKAESRNDKKASTIFRDMLKKKRKEKKMSLKIITDKVDSLEKQFLQMIEHMASFEQGLHNLNGKINIHMKEGHISNETSQTKNRVFNGSNILDNNSGDTD